jgi:hypothetical protein
MKRSLVSYEEYYRELQTQHQENVARLQADYAKRMAIAPQAQLDALANECAAKTKESESGFEKATELLMNAYDTFPSHSLFLFYLFFSLFCGMYFVLFCFVLFNLFNWTSYYFYFILFFDFCDIYLKDVAPAPASLPVSITMTIPSRKLRYEGIVLKPSDLVKDARLILEAKMAERGAKLVAWSPANGKIMRFLPSFRLLSPPSSRLLPLASLPPLLLPPLLLPPLLLPPLLLPPLLLPPLLSSPSFCL